MNNLSRFLSEIAWGLDEQAGALTDDGEAAIAATSSALRDYAAQMRAVAEATQPDGAVAWTRIDGEIGVDLEPEPEPLIRIVFDPQDIETLARVSGVPLATAMERASGWSGAIEEVAKGLCASQLLSVVQDDRL